ncbi:MAG: PLP-dependent aminotransferase family protein [Candidatus Eisenbacteria bacterium]|nr:PLP-dependent aminotransferase family protein [Candidatus Eisenbacteria bacterium]
MEIRIDRESKSPLYEQIAESIVKMIDNNDLRSGDRLPSMRDLARLLGVNRNTVSLAYSTLEKNGLVQSGVGRGTFVRRDGRAHGERPGGDGGFDWERSLARRALEIEKGVLERITRNDGEKRIELTGPVADQALFPVEEFRHVLSEAVREMGPSVLDYGAREGYLPLRRWLAERLSGQGVSIAEEDLFIVSGAQPGLDLVGKLLLDEEDTVAVESPTYYNAIGAFRLYGARLAPVPLDEEGMSVDALEETFRRGKVKLVYCMPTFQNPTGITMSRARRERILEAAARHGAAILEDQFDAELRYGGEPETALRGLPGGENVLFLGTFSKMLFPGLRLGWLVAPPRLHEPILRIRRCSDLTAGLLAQVAIHRFCERGFLDRHLEMVRRVNAARLRALLEAMERFFPEEVRWTRPDGGMTLWVTLPRRVDSVEMLLEARRRGVDFSPGPLFHVDGGGSHAFRLSFSLEPEERIAEGVRVLGDILKGRMTGSPRRPEASPAVLL